MNDLSKQLQAPFEERHIEWRIMQSGFTASGKPYAKVLAYVTNRAIQDRLDRVVGPMGWMNNYTVGPDGGILCGISIRCPDSGDWVTKYDGAENTSVESVKGGLSGSMKRAAVQWGIGRYLYDLETTFAECSTEIQRDRKSWSKAYDKAAKKAFFWCRPSMPKEFLPKKDEK